MKTASTASTRKRAQILQEYRGYIDQLTKGQAGRPVARGLLAHTMGSLDDAHTHFEDALTFCRKGGYRVELAWSCCDYSDMLLERDVEEDRQKATALLDESLAISSELGMRPLIERGSLGR